MVERIDHKEEAIKLLLSQYSDSDTVQLLLESWLTPIQEMEDTLIDFMDHNGISTAQGVMLDIIGGWMGVDRNGRSDGEYRTAILGKSVLEGVDGTTEKLLEAMRILCRSDKVTFEEYPPYTTYAVSGSGWNNTLVDELQRVRPAGTHLRLIVDHHLESMTLNEVLDADNALLLNGEEYEVVVDGVAHILITDTGDVQLADTGDTFAEVTDSTWVPMADLLLTAARVVDNYLVDQDDNFIVDNEGNKFVVRNLEY